MKKSIIFTTFIGFLVLIGGTFGLLFLLGGNNDPTSQQAEQPDTLPAVEFKDEDSSFSFSYDGIMEQIELDEVDISENFILRLQSPSGLEKPFLVSVRKEVGFEQLSNATGKSAVESILENVDRTYPVRFPGYNPIREQTFSFAGVNATEVVFTYDSSGGGKAKQHFLALFPNRNEAFLISMQALNGDFEEIDEKYFVPLRDSIKFE